MRSRHWKLRGEKGSVRISYSGIWCKGLPPVTKMHGRWDQYPRRKGTSAKQMTMFFYDSTDPTAIRRFSRFMLGRKRRKGVDRRQDEALKFVQLRVIGEIDEEDWSKSNYEEENKELDSAIGFTTIAFCMSLQGEEVWMIVIEGLNMFWRETRNHLIPHMIMTLKGRFKGENNLRWNYVPLEEQTKSGIHTRRCISRLLYRRCELEK